MPARRSVLTGLAGLALATPAAAAGKLVEAKKVFPYLDAWLKLAPGDRNRFRMAYFLKKDGRPLTAPVWLIDGATRLPVALRADGRVERLPTLAQLDRAKVQVDVDAGARIGVSMSLEPTMTVAAEMDARELAAALTQASAGMRKALGVLAMAMPKLEALQFLGVTSGEAEFADGRRAPLPVVKGVVTYNPTVMPGARTLRFPKAPGRMEIG